ncbi:MAG: hypothetical protein NZ890_08465, partial [Myxococcota bacterium]|nr:hypothetical protein [Myxococcota bacterium]
ELAEAAAAVSEAMRVLRQVRADRARPYGHPLQLRRALQLVDAEAILVAHKPRRPARARPARRLRPRAEAAAEAVLGSIPVQVPPGAPSEPPPGSGAPGGAGERMGVAGAGSEAPGGAPPEPPAGRVGVLPEEAAASVPTSGIDRSGGRSGGGPEGQGPLERAHPEPGGRIPPGVAAGRAELPRGAGAGPGGAEPAGAELGRRRCPRGP